MTLEEAIKNREDCMKYLEGLGQKASPDCLEAVRWSVKALKALRPVSREQVEKVWRGKWIIQQDEHRELIKKCPKCDFPISGWWGADRFCANCGEAFTDEAVEMVMEKLEELHDTSN